MECRDMPRKLLSLSAALFAIAWSCGWTHAAAAVEWINCEPYYRDLDLAPHGPGPLELAKVYCQHPQYDQRSPAFISPDGLSIAYLETGSSYTVERKVLH